MVESKKLRKGRYWEGQTEVIFHEKYYQEYIDNKWSNAKKTSIILKAVFNWGAKHTFSDTFSIIMTLKFQKSAGLFSFNLWQIMILRTLKKNSQFRNRCCTFSYKSNSVININVTYVFLLRIDEAKIRIENFSEHIVTHIYLSQKGRSLFYVI